MDGDGQGTQPAPHPKAAHNDHQHGGVGGAGGAHQPMRIPIPKNFQPITCDELAALLAQPSASRPSLAIIDVRGPDYVGGHIPGCTNAPYEDLDNRMADLVKEHGTKEYVVFVCMYGQLRSPAAALSFIKALGGDANNAYVLADGFTRWIKQFRGKPDLIENFDQECWNSALEHINDKSPRDLAAEYGTGKA